MLLSSAPMLGVQSSTLIECWRTDGRIMAGAVGAACVVLSWITVVPVIVVFTLWLWRSAPYALLSAVASPRSAGAQHRFIGLRY
ncbi:hypothetical protein D3C78_1751620 [compost metagenome]